MKNKLPSNKKQNSTEVHISLWGKLKHLNRWPKKRPRISLIIIGVVAIICAGVLGWIIQWQPAPMAHANISFKPKPEPIISPLTGLTVASEKIANRPVTAVIIENSIPARPQSGLNQAGVVFETIAEGGVTRFLALYQAERPGLVGPVRSLRPYFFYWAKGYDAGIAHVGGSPDALSLVRATGQKDLDQFFNAGHYWRASSRWAPHNMYTNFDKLDSLNKSKHFSHSKFEPTPRKKSSPAKKPTASDIRIDISGPDYNPQFKYNKKKNTYIRYQAGSKHLNDINKKPIEPKVVVVLKTAQHLEANGYHESIKAVGSGEALIFQDGVVEKGIWHKPSSGSMITLTNSKKQPIELNAGQTWFTIIGNNRNVSW